MNKKLCLANVVKYALNLRRSQQLQYVQYQIKLNADVYRNIDSSYVPWDNSRDNWDIFSNDNYFVSDF